MKRYAVIVAGGQGVRMGADRPKQFLEIGGKPILRHTIERFKAFDPKVDIILVLPEAQKGWWRDYCRQSGFLDRYTMVAGGITRFHSVQNALQYVTGDGVVAVHDGVRPLLSDSLLQRLYEAAEDHPAVIPAIPVVESVRRVDGETSVPVSRDGLVLVQTPQLFDARSLKEAYRQPFSPAFTDDASVYEAAGGKVHIVPGDRINLKITTPDDMDYAAALLAISSFAPVVPEP
ncbi:MAG: 2-C-methyl-D-erythritol 4-phosphate cytidylyltransferase [Bacteroidales bacterium]|nr:2-C-methyl-D-erythritol 4-phosphate cytidylyltransferase [Bacteroidales bacterium]